MPKINETHNPQRRSWVSSANERGSDFPVQNLPFCMFSLGNDPARPAVAIGDQLLDLRATADNDLFEANVSKAIRQCTGGALNPLMKLDPSELSSFRRRLFGLLSEDSPFDGRMPLIHRERATLHLPVSIGGFTDFFTSLHHTERGGRITRPNDPVPPNFRYMPIAYNSRASSVRVSGEDIRRPYGQFRQSDGSIHFGPTQALDFELELGAFVGRENELGTSVEIGEADEHIFGYCLLNDWSARDVQKWESFPLGPFLGKSLSTTISPFVVTTEALAPFRIPACERPKQDPQTLPYLYAENDQQAGGIDLRLEAFIQTRKMSARSEAPFKIVTTNFKHMYWTFSQMLAHHTSNGCNLRVGDLLGSGTVSGPTDESRACLWEITEGKNSIALPNGETRIWLDDEDRVLLRARAERTDYVSIGFGECVGRVVPAQKK
ncbi:fumarylacetoacetase [Bradyrhizobium tunisiense]|uniref:fumarylacetoacetase n=1 Tax=Bradyrhizobium tunisiense TaxID=3278709 RepID=UPI0035E10858